MVVVSDCKTVQEGIAVYHRQQTFKAFNGSISIIVFAFTSLPARPHYPMQSRRLLNFDETYLAGKNEVPYILVLLVLFRVGNKSRSPFQQFQSKI